MSENYTQQIERISKASSLQEIQGIARQYSARTVGEGGFLYSRPVGDVSSEAIALELARKTGEPIINNTPRGQFLADKQVEKTIFDTAKRIFEGQGQASDIAAKSAGDFLYGNSKAVAQSATSLEGSLWGEASKEFAGSLRGDVKVVANNANVERMFGKVELPAVLDNPNVKTLGGQPIAELKPLYAQGGADALLPRVQAQFIEAAPKGIFVAPENAGPIVSKVNIAREAAATLGADATKFSTAAELAEAGLARAPTGFAPAAPSAIAGEVAGAAKGGLRPGMMMKGAAVVGAAALAYDFVSTGHQVMQLEAQGNATGSESAKTHFIGRNVGGIGGGIAVGFLAGAGYGAAGGSPTGPGALVTAGVGGVIGGVGGAFLGEKWAQEKDIERVFTQTDKDGNAWSRDPNNPNAKWSRIAEAQQISATTTVGAENGNATYSNVRYVAGDVLANQLNYKSANASYELGLANLSTPQNPYALPLGKDDAKGVYGGGDWTRDGDTKNWTRQVTDQIGFRGVPISHTETANPERAAELEQSAKFVMAQNAANAPAAIAARYQVAYNQFGWNQYGEVPAAVKDASGRTESLLASDGDLYTRDTNGKWTTPGMIYGTNQASGNLRDELNGMYESQRAGLQQLSVVAAQALANPTLATPAPMRDLVANMYERSGIARSDVQIDAATAALTSTHAREGLDKAGKPYSLDLQPDPATGRPGPNSAIVTMMDDGKDGVFSNSKMVPRAITSAEEIKQAESNLLGSQRQTSNIDGRQAPSIESGNQSNERTRESGLQQLAPADQTMFAKIREGAPANFSDEHVAYAMLRAKQDGISDASKISDIRMSGDTLWVAGTIPGMRASVNINEPVPSMDDSTKQVLASNQLQDQQQAQEMTQRNKSSPSLA